MTFTADVKNVHCLHRHKHRGARLRHCFTTLSITRWSRRFAFVHRI